MSDPIVWFYGLKDPNPEFSNFWSTKEDPEFSLVIDEVSYPSTEAYFHSQKFAWQDTLCYRRYRKHTIDADTPYKAKLLGTQTVNPRNGRYKLGKRLLNDIVIEYQDQVTLDPRWDEIRTTVMLTAQLEKYRQNQHLRVKLLDTGSSMVAERCGCYWGYYGANQLGLALQEVKQQLCDEEV